MKKDLVLPPGGKKIIACIESCKDGNHIIGCLNMIKSYGKIVDRDARPLYYNVKIYLLEQVVKKSKELLISLVEEIEKIKT
jgi:hypothetical protein